ncbi:hypothetical protein [Modestobacter sp. SYSU DS0875]
MWLSSDSETDLRQGDLVRDVPLPTWPQDLLSGGKPAQVAVGLKWRFGVVVSQDCTIEQQNFVQVAVVREIRQPGPDRQAYQALRSTWPPEAGQPYHGYWHALDDHPALVVKRSDNMFVVDLTRQTIITDATQVDRVRALRVGRMTVESRRHLRYRLMYYYGRTEATDAEYLDGIGLSDPFQR